MHLAVLAAMPEELELLKELLDEPVERDRAGVRITLGELDGRPVALALSGIGKVNAAAATQALAGEAPEALIFIGVAGAVSEDLEVGDLVLATDAVQHDVDATALGYELGRVPGEELAWRSDERLLEIATDRARALGLKVRRGRVATGDRFVADPGVRLLLWQRFRADCVEMEGAAAAQVCAHAGIPFLLLRSISDRADGSAEVDFRAFTREAADRAATLTRELSRSLSHLGATPH